MTALRIFLGTGAVLLAVGFWGFLLLMLGFRNASRSAIVGEPAGPMLAMVGVGALAALVLATAIWPGARTLMHTAAGVLGVTAIGLLLLVGKAPVMSTLGLGGVGLWFLYYWLTVWRAAAPVGAPGIPGPTL